jgi:hypothetical protein
MHLAALTRKTNVLDDGFEPDEESKFTKYRMNCFTK